MEISNKIMPLILTAIMSINLSGCGNSTGANDSQPAETSATHVEKTENVIITDDTPKTNEQQYKELSAFDITDWKLEDLTHNIIVDEYSLSFPCKINELPMAFTVIEADEKRDLPARINYNEEILATITISNDYITGLNFYGNSMLDHNICVGKIKYDTTVDEIIEYYGESNYKDKDEWMEHGLMGYAFPDGRIAIDLKALYTSENGSFKSEFIGTSVGLGYLTVEI